MPGLQAPFDPVEYRPDPGAKTFSPFTPDPERPSRQRTNTKSLPAMNKQIQTFALLQNGWQGKEDRVPAWLLLIDAKDKSGQLKTNLADLRKKWIDAGKNLRTEKIRDVEFTTLTVSGEDVARTLEKSLADSKADKENKPAEKSDGKKPASKTTITIGQSDSLLVVGSDAEIGRASCRERV